MASSSSTSPESRRPGRRRSGLVASRSTLVPVAAGLALVVASGFALAWMYRSARIQIVHGVTQQQLVAARSARATLESFALRIPDAVEALPRPRWHGSEEDLRPWLRSIGRAVGTRHVAALQIVVLEHADAARQTVGVVLDHDHPPIRRMPSGRIVTLVCPKCLDEHGLVEWRFPVALEGDGDFVPAVLVLQVRLGALLEDFVWDLERLGGASGWIMDDQGRLVASSPGAVTGRNLPMVRDSVKLWVAWGVTEGTGPYTRPGRLAFASTTDRDGRFFVVVAPGAAIVAALRSSALWIGGAWTFGLVSVVVFGLLYIRGERRRREAERACEQLELERLRGDAVSERARARMQEALQQYEKLATIGSLSAGIAHQMRNPLAAVRGALELLSPDVVAAVESGALDGATKGVHRLQAVVDDLTRFVRSGDRARVVFDLVESTQRVLRVLAPLFADVRVHFDGPSEASMIGAPGLIDQVLLNLLQNAVQACGPRGEIGVRVGTGPNRVFLEVHDTGPGIPRELHERIFEPLFTTKAPGEGTGLGLSLARSIVEEHGGVLAVDSRPGFGTTFRATMPVSGERAGDTGLRGLAA